LWFIFASEQSVCHDACGYAQESPVDEWTSPCNLKAGRELRRMEALPKKQALLLLPEPGIDRHQA